MTTFRNLIGNINKTTKPTQQSSLEAWFENVLDVPIDDLEVEDLCRAIRQKVCVDQLMPKALAVLIEDPLAGEYYDGELIAALATINGSELQDHKETFINIRNIVSRLNSSDVDNELSNDILKIEKIVL